MSLLLPLTLAGGPMSQPGHASSSLTGRVFSAAAVGPNHRAAEPLLTLEEALKLAFPGCEVQRQTVYLTKQQTEAIAKEAPGFKSRIIYPYRATKNGKIIGTAYVDTHRVRSLKETLMVVVAPDFTVRRVEVLAFAEPKEYIPRQAWYDQFPGRKLDKELQLNRKILNLTGATLTARATVNCSRRVLTLHQHLVRLDKLKISTKGSTPEKPSAKKPIETGEVLSKIEAQNKEKGTRPSRSDA